MGKNSGNGTGVCRSLGALSADPNLRYLVTDFNSEKHGNLSLFHPKGLGLSTNQLLIYFQTKTEILLKYCKIHD